MLKHATITRTSRVQQELQKHWDQQMREQQQTEQVSSCDDPMNTLRSNQPSFVGANDGSINADPSDNLASPSWPSSSMLTTAMASKGMGQLMGSCNPSPSPKSTPTSKFSVSSAPSSVFSSPSKTYPNGITSDNTLSSINGFSRSSSNTNMDTSKTHISAPISTTTTSSKCGSESMIKVFAQTLSQEVEYVTLHVNAQTKSQQIIRSLLKKFRLKHRDPNLFYLTLERWIRKDGLKQKSVMLLSDEACPLQLQQCCSNPPHNDIKFTLQMRAGALMKIYCSDVCPNTRYKCLSLSTQTSVDETIELMLHCLNLIGATTATTTTTTTSTTITASAKCGGNQSLSSHYNNSNNNNASRMRLAAGSPSLTDSSSTSSASSTTSSSSGIESDPMLANNQIHHQQSPYTGRLLDSSSRTNSVTSISSSSNISNTSCSHLGEQFCLIIECRDTNYRRILESDEHLVDVYQSLLDEAREKEASSAAQLQADSNGNFNNLSPKSSLRLSELENTINKQKSDQWFLIKLKRREEVVMPTIKSTTPRQNMPLPPIPLSLTQFNNNDHLHSIVSTTQIEVNNTHRPFQHHHRQTSALTASLARTKTRPESATCNNNAHDMVDGNFPPQSTIMSRNNNNILPHYRQTSAIVTSQSIVVDTQQASDSSMPPPPASLIWLPPVRPRRRNLSNVSTSTFGRPQIGSGAAGTAISHQLNNRRRYDPAQLAHDLDRLDLSDNLIATSTTTKVDSPTGPAPPPPPPQPPAIPARLSEVREKLNKAEPSVVVSLNKSGVLSSDDLLTDVTKQSDNNSNSNQLVVLVEPPLEEVRLDSSAELASSVAITTATDQFEP